MFGNTLEPSFTYAVASVDAVSKPSTHACSLPSPPPRLADSNFLGNESMAGTPPRNLPHRSLRSQRTNPHLFGASMNAVMAGRKSICRSGCLSQARFQVRFQRFGLGCRAYRGYKYHTLRKNPESSVTREMVCIHDVAPKVRYFPR